MDSRLATKKMNRDVSPDRAKLCVQPKARQQARKVAQVVYYLSRGGQLEHPHFMEVELANSNEELYLRDVIDRLTILRGKGMPSLFSWSCKRSYKNGYVWNDLSENDIIYPAHGIEYVLKGSELFEGCLERYQENNTSGKLTSDAKQGTVGVYSQGKASNNGKSLVPKRRLTMIEADGLPAKLQDANNKNISAGDGNSKQLIIRGEDMGGSSSETQYGGKGSAQKSHGNVRPEYPTYKSQSMDLGADASTQTHQAKRCSRGVSTQEEPAEEDDSKHGEGDQNSTELSGGEESPPSSSSASTEGLNPQVSSLTKIKPTAKLPADGLEEEIHITDPIVTSKFRTSTSHKVLMQLISCGSIAVKDHKIVVIPQKARHAAAAQTHVHASEQHHEHSAISSAKNISLRAEVVCRSLARATVEDELQCMSENPRFGNLQFEEKEYFSGSLIETKAHKQDGDCPALTKSSSYNADKSSKSEMVQACAKDAHRGGHGGSAKAKCIPRKKSSKKPR